MTNFKKLFLIVSLGFTGSLLVTGLAQAYTFDDDVPQATRDQITTDLAFMASLTGSGATAFHKQIYGSVGGNDYKQFFETRVTAVGLNDCGSAKAVACVIPMFDASKIWLTDNYTKFSHPQVAKMMVVYHEARHTESQNGNWGHATCPTPYLDADGKDMKSIWTGASLAGEPACDITPFGSYGSSTIMLKNIQMFCSNCTDKVKMDAGIYSDDQLKRVTDEGAHSSMLADFKAGAAL